MVWCNYEWAWGGRYTHFYKEQSLNGCDILEHELQPIRFQGQFYDVETGLHYNRFRYYDSDVGMFIQKDPIGLLGGVNVFAYAPNPVGWVDPWGLSAQGGGSYGLTRKQSTAGQVNHMPAHNSIQKSGLSITHYSAPATWMSTADHLNTASWGSSTNAKKWRAVQSDLLARNKFGKAMEMDIKDIQRKFGSTYNFGMSEMVDYAKEQGYIDNREARRLKRKYRLCH